MFHSVARASSSSNSVLCYSALSLSLFLFLIPIQSLATCSPVRIWKLARFFVGGRLKRGVSEWWKLKRMSDSFLPSFRYAGLLQIQNFGRLLDDNSLLRSGNILGSVLTCNANINRAYRNPKLGYNRIVVCI